MKRIAFETKRFSKLYFRQIIRALKWYKTGRKYDRVCVYFFLMFQFLMSQHYYSEYEVFAGKLLQYASPIRAYTPLEYPGTHYAYAHSHTYECGTSGNFDRR